jgi:beta-mannosidase
MVLNWCFNEPWPAAANNSLIAYPSVPKPAVAAVRDACRPLCASAVIHKFVWRHNELFTTDLWFLNDTCKQLSGLSIVVSLQAGDQELCISTWQIPEVKPNQHVSGPTVTFLLPSWQVKLFKLILAVQENAAFNAEYTLVYSTDKY